MNTTLLTQVEMTEKEIDLAEIVAKRLGYTQTAYTSTSELVGLYCLRDSADDPKRGGCVIKTKELGTLFVQCLEDLGMHDLYKKEMDAFRKEAKK